MLNCSGVRMACHSSSDLCTGPGGGVDDDIADTPGNLRPAARPLHGRGAGRGRAAAGEGARRREDSGREARGGAGARVRCHPQPQQTLDAHVVALVALRIMWSGDEEREPMFFPFVEGIRVGRQQVWFESGSCLPACGPAWIRIRMFLYSDKEASASSFDIKP